MFTHKFMDTRNDMRGEMHQPVLTKELMDLLDPKEGGVYIDGTVGSGGHARAVLEIIGPDGRLLGIDRDIEAIRRAEDALLIWQNQVCLKQGNYAEMKKIADAMGVVSEVDGIILDLGVSSEQLALDERGFSFMRKGPLDMRMDQSEETTAAELLRNLSEDELAAILRDMGEDPHAKRIARMITRQRIEKPIETTDELVEVIVRAVGGRGGKRHPATRTFQALRIAVNKELTYLRKGLAEGLDILKPGGRMAVISFHSLEDRIVKHCFAEHVGRSVSLEQGGCRWEGKEPKMLLVNKKPMTVSKNERIDNPRARSAKLRVAERRRNAQPDSVS